MHITRQESDAMRGIAILGIVLHNFTHWLHPMVKENEYTFNAHNVERIAVEMLHPNADLPFHLLSFFGHYGVPIFLFLSAYGLVAKYEREEGECGIWNFLSSHYKKLFIMMITGYSAFVLIDYMTPHPRHYEIWNIIGQLTMTSNLFCNPDHAIWPGPYWYFGLMVQVYLVYRLVLYRGKGSITGKMTESAQNLVAVAIAMILLLAQLFMEPLGDALNWYRYNVFGALPVFVFGMILARRGSSTPRSKMSYLAYTLLLSVLCIFGSMTFLTWIVVPFVVCLFTLCFVRCLPCCILKIFSWIGTISAAMFVCHPIARKILIPISHRGDIMSGVLLYIVSTIVLSILFKHVIAKVKREIG